MMNTILFGALNLIAKYYYFCRKNNHELGDKNDVSVSFHYFSDLVAILRWN